MLIDLYKKSLLPRLCFMPYFVAKAFLSLCSIYYLMVGSTFKGARESYLCIEAGVKGWDSIEFKEIYQSACEYYRPDRIRRLEVTQDISYFEQIKEILKGGVITHYVYDPRTSNSDMNFWSGIWDSFRVSLLLNWYGVIPIVLLSDLSIRSWRTQAAIVSAQKGVVVSFMSPKVVGAIFPHGRLIGPGIMPFSIKTLKIIDKLIEEKPKREEATVIFAGSMYEPRTTKLLKIQSGLLELGYHFDIKGRVMGSMRVPDIEYWSRLSHNDIIVTTADQAIQVGADWNHIPHLIYRYIEILASGALCIAQDVPSVRRYFTPGIHFISFDTTEDAVKVIANYLINKEERLVIAKRGKERADALIRSRTFWVTIDTALTSKSIL